MDYSQVGGASVGFVGSSTGMTKQLRNWKADVDAIRKVLMCEWDPIGCGVPEDEYDSYIPMIYRLMQSRCSVAELASHLGGLETGSMGLSERPAVNRRVAEMPLNLME
jgi:hypothetical protein